MARQTSYSKSQLNKFLAIVGQEAQTIDDDGTPITNEEAVARLLYKKALGWTETVTLTDEYNNTAKHDEVHPPENWALQYVFERREGKAPQAVQSAEDKRGMTASETVRELANARVLSITAKSSRPTGPPRHKPNG